MIHKEADTNNIVTLLGTINQDLKFSHEMHGEKFFEFIMEVPRLSNSVDNLVVTISERLMDLSLLTVGKKIKVLGQLRSYNNESNKSGNKLKLTIFSKEVLLLEEDDEEYSKSKNEILLNGFLCKSPIFRETPMGREITDIILAVNRSYKKSDYIPILCWGRNARYSKDLKVGDNIKVWGRVQSRSYDKKISDTETETRIAYEVSISKIEKIEKSNESDN